MKNKDRVYKLKKLTLPKWRFKLFLFKEWLKFVYKRLDKMFYWCGVFVFDGKLKKYGGHNHFIAGKIFRWKLTYLFISITYNIGFKIHHNDDETYYDGYHNTILIGFIRINYGT